MNASQRVRARLAGEAVDQPPNFNIYMTFAAHHFGARLSDYYLDHRVLAAANLAMVDDYQVDLLQAISDPYREAADLGLAVEFPPDSLPVNKQPLLVEPADLSRLRPVAPANGRRMSDRLAAVQAMQTASAGQVPVMGWVEGALAEAADLRGVSALMVDLLDRPAWVHDLLEVLVEVGIAFARAQVDAGADIIGLGDAVCSQVSPRLYRQFGLPYEQRVFQAVRAMGALPRLHICGNTSRILPDMAQSGAAIIDVDWMVDYSEAARAFEGLASPCGNFDPVAVLLQGTPEDVSRATRACLDAGGPRCFSAAGCEVPDGTPPANLQAQNRTLREYYTRRG